MKKLVIHLVMVALIIVLGYCLYDSIMQPIRFQKKADWRKELTVQSLKNIRDAQIAFKSQTGHYAKEFDTLIDFIQNGRIKIVKAIGNIPDSFYNKYPRKVAEQKAIEAGIVKRDTIEVRCYDSLCGNRYNLAQLKFVPTTTTPFEMDADTLETASKVKVPVFEAKAPYEVYLQGLDKQEIINMKDEAQTLGRYPGLKVGSLTEYNNNAGNWE